MNPVKIITLLFLVNAMAIGTVLQLVAPKSYADFGIQDVAIQQIDTNNTDVISGRPTRLIIEAAAIDIIVASGTYDESKNSWDLSGDKAHYATITPEANNKAGNTFIYGHNKKGVFATLDRATIGSKAIVKTDTGRTFTYTLRSVSNVSPTDISLFTYRGPSILTLQTCSGTWFEKRQLYHFEFTEVI